MLLSRPDLPCYSNRSDVERHQAHERAWDARRDLGIPGSRVDGRQAEGRGNDPDDGFGRMVPGPRNRLAIRGLCNMRTHLRRSIWASLPPRIGYRTTVPAPAGRDEGRAGRNRDFGLVPGGYDGSKSQSRQQLLTKAPGCQELGAHVVVTVCPISPHMCRRVLLVWAGPLRCARAPVLPQTGRVPDQPRRAILDTCVPTGSPSSCGVGVRPPASEVPTDPLSEIAPPHNSAKLLGVEGWHSSYRAGGLGISNNWCHFLGRRNHPRNQQLCV